MTGHTKSKEQIVADLHNKISEILSVPTDTVEKSENFWELFDNFSLQKMTDFEKFVANEYKIYLTEREWETHSLDKLADHILNRQANPQHMLAHIHKDFSSLKKQQRFALIGVPLILGVCGIYSVINSPHPERRLHDTLFFAILSVLGAISAYGIISMQMKKFKDEISPVLQHYNYDPEEKSPDNSK